MTNTGLRERKKQQTRELIAETIAKDPAPLAADPLAARLLLEALIDPADSAQPSAFEVMHQLGILNALMPEWAPCTARVQHDLYHTYTVDQHQLYALAMQKRIARGELAEAHPLATELWRGVKRPAPLYLATLLHDVGKPLGKGHAEKGAVIAGAIARRFGMTEDDAELTEMLVRQHLTMSHLSQRRDLSDPEVIARFGEKIVETDERPDPGVGEARLNHVEAHAAEDERSNGIQRHAKGAGLLRVAPA
jgi:[protein-PII] uridylyltransferase